MEEKPLWYELIERKNNFHGNFDPLEIHNKSYYRELQGLCEMIDVDIDKLGFDKKYLPKMIFSRIYNFVISFNDNYKIFDNNTSIYYDVFNACFFTTLCMFLYNTKRIKGMSQRKFIYTYSPLKYNIKGSPNYFDYGNTKRESIKSQSIISEDTNLRKYRQRLLSEREVYNDSPEWSAIRKVSEHEWTLYYLLDDADTNVIDTSKRIRNLYHGIYDAIYSPWDSGYKGRLENAYDKFSAKLEKLKYENVINLDKYYLEHICKDKTCYGINLYRFEKELRLYNITNEVNQLLRCKDEDEEAYVLDKSMIMNKIFFPKLYKDFGDFINLKKIDFYTRAFCSFLDELVNSSYLVIDKFIDEDILGKDWEDIFLKTINEMSEEVFYNPKEIDYSVTPESQEMFFYDIAIPVCKEIERHFKLSQFMQIPPSESDDEI